MSNLNMDLMQIIGLLKGRNPKELVMSMMKNNQINDPTLTQLINYAENGDINNLTSFAETYFSKQGKNFNSEFQNFMSLLK